MDALLHAIRTLSIMLIGLGVMIGMVSPSKAFKMIARIIIVPIAVIFVWTFALEAWASLPTLTRVAVVALGVPASGAALLMGTHFGREVLASVIGNWLYDRLRGGCGMHALLLLLLLVLAATWLLA